ncbi:MAG: hypothetical protein IM596_13770 [Pseudanabaena sp. M051S1SP2A07QC]|nr:hypothetical protein [Pseudanabaena sp. M090S1SP2A07QC]MCA6506688.1 hypothetical protein [Pseudanabaena sp. M172S2SP2A07QC]MCA6522872.1 hypothetical protein [Pseudanabaena sp. M051S1SP2A07QC]MCA6546322.1 hypothetical protein [Pseudanabaena sp. M152S2SP2A07QC]
MTESARIGSAESSDVSSLVNGIDFPKSQLAKSSGKFSARNLQVLSYIGEFYHFNVSHSYSHSSNSHYEKLATVIAM